jgi:hypothetical protein
MKMIRFLTIMALGIGSTSVRAEEDESSGRWYMTCSYADNKGYSLIVKQKGDELLGTVAQMSHHGARVITQRDVQLEVRGEDFGDSTACSLRVSFKGDGAPSDENFSVYVPFLQSGYRPHGMMTLNVDGQPIPRQFQAVTCDMRNSAVVDAEDICDRFSKSRSKMGVSSGSSAGAGERSTSQAK